MKLRRIRKIKSTPFTQTMSILIFANKQDLPRAADTNTVVNALNLFNLMRHRGRKM